MASRQAVALARLDLTDGPLLHVLAVHAQHQGLEPAGLGPTGGHEHELVGLIVVGRQVALLGAGVPPTHQVFRFPERPPGASTAAHACLSGSVPGSNPTTARGGWGRSAAEVSS